MTDSVDTPEFRKLEAAYAKAIFDFTDDASKTNGESMATARNAFVAHIDSLIAGVRKDAERMDFVTINTDKTLSCHRKGWMYRGFTNYEVDLYSTPRDAIDAAMAAHSPATSGKDDPLGPLLATRPAILNGSKEGGV